MSRNAIFTYLTALAFVACSASSPSVARYHVTQDAPYRFDNTILRLQFNLGQRLVFGHETAFVRPKTLLVSLPFHSSGIDYDSIAVDGGAARFSVDDSTEIVNVELPAPARAGHLIRVDFTYHTKPLRGIYFVLPDKAYPHLTPQIWSQGEPTDNRRWFPTWDEPNQKTPSELILTVPGGWTAIANGILKRHTHDRDAEVWDWDSPTPKSTYLIAFAAGPLTRDHTALGKLDIDSFVQPRDAKFAETCFGNTKAMIAFYDRTIGIPFPFEKYDQVTAERFAFGGMEDASATIVTNLALHPSVEDVEASCDVLVSHELAQHWYGDDATMSDWSNLWLNEGFATYYDELWTRERFGEAAFEYARYKAQQTYLSGGWLALKPLVDYVYTDPLTLFDANSHERPAAVLHMLRWMLGDQRYFAAMRKYLQTFSYRNADTEAFFSTIETALGTNLTWFKDEWFYRSAYPHFYVSDRYNKNRHVLLLTVTQRNADGQPFRMPVEIEVFFAGRTVDGRWWINRNEQSIEITHISSTPSMTLFDPNNNLLRELTFPKKAAELAYQLARAPHISDREWALQQFASQASSATAVEALEAAASSDPFWGIRADAIGIAAAAGDASAVRRALEDPDVRVRLAAENAAATLPKADAFLDRALIRMTRDRDPNVAAAALASLGVRNPPGVSALLEGALREPSFRQTIAAGALEGLAPHCSAATYSLIETRTAYGTQEQERAAAVRALATCAKSLKRSKLASQRLSQLLSHDPLISTRIAAIQGLVQLADHETISTLESAAANDSQELVREIALSAVAQIAGTK